MNKDLAEREFRRLVSRRKWDAEHLRCIGTKLTPKELERFDVYCERVGQSRYAVLRDLVLELLSSAID